MDSAIGKLCHHADRLRAFLSEALRRPPCRDEDLRFSLSRLMKAGGHPWPSKEALVGCLRLVIDAAHSRLSEDEIVDIAHDLFVTIQSERSKLLSQGEELILRALQEAATHATLPREAYLAVARLADSVRTMAAVTDRAGLRLGWNSAVGATNAALVFAGGSAPKKRREPENEKATRAMVELAAHPDWRDSDISRATGIAASWFSRNSTWAKLSGDVRGSAAPGRILAGSVDGRTGAMVVASPVQCSRLIQARCSDCGEAIRVNPSEAGSDNYCERCGD